MKDKISIRHLSQSKRQKILDRDIVCVYCGDDADCVDHVVPYSWSQCDDEDNLVACCTRCNLIAGGIVFKDFDQKCNYIKNRLKAKRYHDNYSVCTNCHKMFKPRCNGSTIFLCSDCVDVEYTTKGKPVKTKELLYKLY